MLADAIGRRWSAAADPGAAGGGNNLLISVNSLRSIQNEREQPQYPQPPCWRAYPIGYNLDRDQWRFYGVTWRRGGFLPFQGSAYAVFASRS